jgi:hypothetical protein
MFNKGCICWWKEFEWKFGLFFLDPEDIKGLIWGPSGTLAKAQGSLELYQIMGHLEPVFKA